jgi:phosphorylcholine metabolism protein LicD
MNFANLLDKLWSWVIYIGLPVVQAYHLICGNVFFNTSAEEAQGIEKAANYVLAPTQYLLAGRTAFKVSDSSAQNVDPEKIIYTTRQRFEYEDYFLFKTAISCISMPISTSLGGVIKALAFLSSETRDRHCAIIKSLLSKQVDSNNEYYRSIGLEVGDFLNSESIESPKYERRPGDEGKLLAEKEALKQITAILRNNRILHWVDCGTCLGTYRYGGIIPWDWDLDLGVLQPDFENVKHALNALDKNKYVIQDWSGRDRPNTYLKVYIKESRSLIDIYHFAIDEKKQVISSIFSNENSIAFPESWKIRERRYTLPIAFDIIFPLKKGIFDGVEVPVPGRTKEFLQSRYGENISPVKIYNPLSGKYENDLTHPYWQLPHNR